MHSVTIILKTRRTKAELHIKGIHKVYIKFAFKVDFLKMVSFRVQKFWLLGQTSGSDGWVKKMP